MDVVVVDVVEVVEDEETVEAGVEADVETDVVVDVDDVVDNVVDVDDELVALVVVEVELEDIWIGRVTSPVSKI